MYVVKNGDNSLLFKNPKKKTEMHIYPCILNWFSWLIYDRKYISDKMAIIL